MAKSQLLSKVELSTRCFSHLQERRQKKDNRVRKCHFQWTTEATMILIESVGKMENLWNPCYPSYKDRRTHQKSWESIAKSLSLPKQEVVVKWNSLRSNYRIFLKNRRGITGGREGNKQRSAHRFFLAMAFLDPVLKIESNLVKVDNSKKNISEVQSRSSSDHTDLDNNLMQISNIDGNSSLLEIKDEIPSLMSDENSTSVSQVEYNTPQDFRPPILLYKKVKRVYNKRKIQTLDDDKEEQEKKAEEDLESLKRTKLRLQIYNLQLDAVKKEIELGLERSQLTEELYKNWDVPIKDEKYKDL